MFGPGLSFIDGFISLCLKLMSPICEVNYMSTVSIHYTPTAHMESCKYLNCQLTPGLGWRISIAHSLSIPVYICLSC